MTVRYYLAHPIGTRHDVRKWELAFEKRTGIELGNPFYDTERTDIKAIDEGRMDPFDPNLDSDSIVEGDLKMINERDGTVAMVSRAVPTAGTYYEIWHTFLSKKPVFFITPDSGTHPWHIYIAKHSGGFIVKTVEEFEQRIGERV